MGEMRNKYKILIAKPEGKGPRKIARRRWEDNIRMALRVIVLEDVDLMLLAQDRDHWQAL
jgi:precorrin-6B methylase 1